MTLYELTDEWFSFLRVSVGEGENLRLGVAEMQDRLLSILRRMEQEASTDPSTREDFTRVKFALVAFADEILINSEWPYREAWAQQRLEMREYESMVGGDKFFQDLGEARKQKASADVLGIYFLCIALGFRGAYYSQPETLRGLQLELFNAIPQRVTNRMDEICPDAYSTETRDYTPRPKAAIWRAVFAASTFTLIALILGSFFL